MRQQQNTCAGFLIAVAQMKSRSMSCLRMLRSLSLSQLEMLTEALKHNPRLRRDLESKGMIPQRNVSPNEKIDFFDRICDYVARMTGALSALIIYFLGILVWLGLGDLKSLEWGNEWQLYINTAVTVQLNFTSMFLQNVRQRHLSRPYSLIHPPSRPRIRIPTLNPHR